MARRRTSQGSWPAFDSAFLAEIVAALRRKGRSLPRSVDGWSCERNRERTGGADAESLEVSFELPGPPPVGISLHCWDDRWLELDVRAPATSGRAVEWRHEGRVGVAGPVAVADLLTETAKLPFESDPDFALECLTDRCAGIAITGPRGAVGSR